MKTFSKHIQVNSPADKRIVQFIQQHHIFTLAVAKNNFPYCATCFYVYLEEDNMLVFTSDRDTRHIMDMETGDNNCVAGAIALETSVVGKIRGIQFTGVMDELKGERLRKAKKAYLHRFPIARMTRLLLWGLTPDYIKLTDNRLGFGTKLIWKQGQG